MGGKAVIMRLKAATQSYSMRVDHSGSSPRRFSQLDAAWCTAGAGIPLGARVLLEMIYAGGTDTATQEAAKWIQQSARESLRERSSDPRFRVQDQRAEVMFGRVVSAAIYVLVAPNLCPSCLGRGRHIREHKVYRCARCRGRGRGKTDARILRRLFEIPRRDWDRRWGAVLGAIVRDIRGRLEEMLEEIGRRAG